MTDIEIASTVKLKPITEIAPRPDSARPDARQASDFGIGHLPDSGRRGENDHIDRIDRRAEPDR